jgi:hypothetical protein
MISLAIRRNGVKEFCKANATQDIRLSKKKKKKRVRNTIKNRNSTRAIRWCSLHPRGSIFFFGGGVIFLDFDVPNVFPPCYQSIPYVCVCPPSSQLVPQDVPNSIKPYALAFVQSWTFITYKKLGQRKKHFYIPILRVQTSIWKISLPKFKNFGYDGQSK